MNELEIGVVLRPHGLSGELKVRLHWAESEALVSGRPLVLRLGETSLASRIDSVRGGPRALIVKLAGIDDRTAAERVRGAKLCVDRAELPPLEDDEFYLADLVGYRVLGPDGAIGTVVEIGVHPTVDSLIIEVSSGARLEQPLGDPVVEAVDHEARVVRLASTEGLIDI